LIPLLRIRTVIYSDLVGLSHLTVQLETPSGLGANDQALSPAGYEPNHDKLRYDQKRQVSTPSRKKCGHLRRKESLEASQTVQGKPERRRQGNDVDQNGGHRRHKAKTASRRPRGRSSILWRKQTTGDMHLPCSHPSEATTHIASDCKAKNYDVQPLRKGSVDHKRLRNDDHHFPLRH